MAEILVLVEHADGTPKKVTYEMLTKARALGEPSAVFVGRGYAAAKDKLAEYGAAKVYVAEGDEYADHPVAPAAEVLASLMSSKSPAAVFVASSADGKEVAARTAVKTGSGILTDATDVAEGFVATQSVFGGATVVQSRAKGTPIITLRPNSTPPVAA